ncbi:hypothetical protein K490DRAFT_54972 [Saccharata proteae CBS 121410]|uniref:Uncharacterized protein n=1 Tax=Saccharata proteae CBS 121410 TaxID=1314787 RepID=A0A6A5YDE5_9PEZI|nr:hypothetical protein K490DRAFT_54972 [Saccharata proteae CBS 121410]
MSRRPQRENRRPPRRFEPNSTGNEAQSEQSNQGMLGPIILTHVNDRRIRPRPSLPFNPNLPPAPFPTLPLDQSEWTPEQRVRGELYAQQMPLQPPTNTTNEDDDGDNMPSVGNARSQTNGPSLRELMRRVSDRLAENERTLHQNNIQPDEDPIEPGDWNPIPDIEDEMATSEEDEPQPEKNPFSDLSEIYQARLVFNIRREALEAAYPDALYPIQHLLDIPMELIQALVQAYEPHFFHRPADAPADDPPTRAEHAYATRYLNQRHFPLRFLATPTAAQLPPRELERPAAWAQTTQGMTQADQTFFANQPYRFDDAFGLLTSNVGEDDDEDLDDGDVESLLEEVASSVPSGSTPAAGPPATLASIRAAAGSSTPAQMPATPVVPSSSPPSAHGEAVGPAGAVNPGVQRPVDEDVRRDHRHTYVPQGCIHPSFVEDNIDPLLRPRAGDPTAYSPGPRLEPFRAPVAQMLPPRPGLHRPRREPLAMTPAAYRHFGYPPPSPLGINSVAPYGVGRGVSGGRGGGSGGAGAGPGA